MGLVQDVFLRAAERIRLDAGIFDNPIDAERYPQAQLTWTAEEKTAWERPRRLRTDEQRIEAAKIQAMWSEELKETWPEEAHKMAKYIVEREKQRLENMQKGVKQVVREIAEDHKKIVALSKGGAIPPLPPAFKDAIDDDRAVDNGNGTVSPVKSLENLLDYLAINHGNVLTRSLLMKYVRKNDGSPFNKKVIDTAISTAKINSSEN
jgi:hypothetical protein